MGLAGTPKGLTQRRFLVRRPPAQGPGYKVCGGGLAALAKQREDVAFLDLRLQCVVEVLHSRAACAVLSEPLLQLVRPREVNGREA